MAKWFIAIALLLCSAARSPAQRPFSGTPDIEQSLRRLNELGSVLMIAAHPDDERTAVLAYFARGRHMRTAYLSLTRGEGGQNLIGSEQGAQLGLIRTQELLDARQIDGAEQFFTRAIDFGFSKTAAETLQKWGHDRILSDVVWIIRSFRPDVVILCFSGTPRDGHGHHQASAILGKEAFQVAGDPAKFPEQLKYVKPWKARRLVHVGFGDFGRGGRAAQQPAEPQLPKSGSADTGALNPILGYSYDEIAVLSRSMHHSQGTGAMRRPGPGTADFELVSGDPASKDLFDGIDTSWNRLPGGAAINTALAEAIRAFDPQQPDKVIPLLLKARPLIAQISDPTAHRKLQELDETVALCAGLWMEAQASQPEVTPGSQFTVTTTVLNRSTTEVTVAGDLPEANWPMIWDQRRPVQAPRLDYNKSSSTEYKIGVPASQPYTQPYWLVKPPSDGVYTVDDQRLVGLPESPPAVQVRFSLVVAGTSIQLLRPVHYRYADRALGERERALAIVPPVAVNMPVSSALFPAATPNTVHVAVRAHAANISGDLRIELPPGWTAEPRSQPLQLHAAGEQQELTFQVTPPAGESIGTLRAVATVGGREISDGIQTISYPHIPIQLLFPPSELKLVRCDVHVTAHRIGYIMGAGDEMPDALRQLGLEVTLLSPSDVEQGDLSRFDAIVAGVRAYNVRSDLRANHQRLMSYVQNGGVYVVQYQTAEGGFGPPRGQPRSPDAHIGPYPIAIPGGNQYRITVEDVPVTFPHPDSPLLQTPNHITEHDFQGWVQERGLYFATEWDKHYETVLSAADPGEKPQEGGELWTHYGKGVYIFTAYSWFRQLPGGVAGAYRLFANLLSAK
jgi:LmbE family N-acetylglucosaminyl deacetylase